MRPRNDVTTPTRRRFLGQAAALSLGGGMLTRAAVSPGGTPAVPPNRKALVAISLDLEMSRNFPTWDQTHWDYEKGNLNAETKAYAVEAAQRVRERGGVIHFFALGRVLEQEDTAWLASLVRDGHPVGNHTYDHVNLRATKTEDLQFRFRRAPWLIAGKDVPTVLRENIALTTSAMRDRLGIGPAGFRTPGGFTDGLRTRPDLQKMLQELGFKWVSSVYPAHPNSQPAEDPGPAVFEGIVKAQAASQPFVYPGGLIEVPMSPISDIGAFRNGRWKLDHFLRAIRSSVEWCIEHGACFDFLGHPSCLYVSDPQFKAVELICELVNQNRERAALCDLHEIARRA
jgi:hypothetical protein